MNDQQLKDAQDFLRQTIGKNPPPVYSDDTITAYAVTQAPTDQQAPAQFLDIGDGWFGVEKSKDQTWRWAKSGGPSEIYAMNLTKNPVTVKLNFSAFSFKTDRSLQVALNNSTITSYNLSATGGNQNFELSLTLAPGNNIITFSSPQAAVVPSKLDPTAKDDRQLTFALSNLKLN
jgi:hypothetical protein